MSLKTPIPLLSVLSVSIALSLIGKIAMASQSENSTETDEHKMIIVTGEVYVGAHHDSNVNVSELDTNTDTSDSAIKGNAKLKVAIMPTDKWQITASAQHSETRYSELSDFDLAITTLSGEASYQSSWAKIGIHHYYANANLDDNAFLTYQQSGISLANSAFTQGYWRISVDTIDKSFESVPERDAKALSSRIDGFWFFENHSFIQVGVKYQNEDALAQAFDYTSHGIDASYTYPANLWGKALDIKLGYEMESRLYGKGSQSSEPTTSAVPFSEIEQQEDGRREDNRHVFEASIEYTAMENVDFIVSTQYKDYGSTLVSADYQETLAEIGVRFHF
ncbi:hypothetical protein J8L84_07610 [Alteromonas sp. MMG017]|uniref:hypothetical protein n=1 Tax=Alteromonas sp. MMG017 TaxID=2822692 RepID=UPI001B3A7891|nr:hypothetical protein [Alteromonas sp. MMG017]MBQ4829139.1 hypothetical protein [Alteromonas sp. MMG017]